MKNTAKHTKLAALFITPILAMTVASCSGDGGDATKAQPGDSPTVITTDTVAPSESTSPTAPVTSVPTSVPTLTPSSNGKTDYCKDQKPFTGAAADKFGADNVAAAYCTFVTLEMNQTFVENYLRNNPAVTAKDFTVWDRYMTQSAQTDWDNDVKQALAGDSTATQNVNSLMFYDILKGSPYSFSTDPAVLNQSFTPATTDVQTVSGQDQLVLKFSVTANVDVVQGDNPDYYLVPIKKDLTLNLVQNPDQSNPEMAWLIDGWSSTYQAGQPVKRGNLTTSSSSSPTS